MPRDSRTMTSASKTRRIIASQTGSNDRGLDSIEPKPAERNARQVQRGGHEAGCGMGVQPQEHMPDFVGHHVAEDITYLCLSPAGHILYAIAEYAYETSTRGGPPSVPRSGLTTCSIPAESRPTWMMDSPWTTSAA